MGTLRAAHLRLSVYRTGGGERGNVSVGQIRVLKTSVPYVARVENRCGGVVVEIDAMHTEPKSILRDLRVYRDWFVET